MKDIPNSENKIDLLEVEQKNESQNQNILDIKTKNKQNTTKQAIIMVSIVLITVIIILIIFFRPTIKKPIPLVDYDEAEKIVDPKETKANHQLLNDTLFYLDYSLLNSENMTFPEINATIGEMPENLDFLKNTTNSSLIIAKEDLEFYVSQYSNMPEQINNITELLSDVIKKIPEHLKEYKTEINNLTKQYELNIQNLAMPILANTSNSTILRKLDTNDKLSEYNKETNKLNKFYSNVFKQQLEEVKNVSLSVAKIKETAESIQKKFTETFSKTIEIIKSITEDSFHEELLLIKEKFAAFRNMTYSLKNELKSIGIEILNISSSLGKEETDIIECLKDFSKKMGVSTINISHIISDFFEINKKINNKMKIYGKNSIVYIKEILMICNSILEYLIDYFEEIKIEESTSLDLLFIVDITGSMQPYFEAVKKKMITIINGIVKECPGIDINLGFIGYEDFYENNYNIGFTKDHNYVKAYISKIYTEGGGSYYPDEDVALALELALKKNWKSVAKLAVFIADAPGHGEKYGGHDTDQFDPKRREIDEMITQMAEEDISLFCLNITSQTDKMFEVFEDIYNAKKSNNTLFQILDFTDDSFSDIIINYAIKVYLQQRQSLKEEKCLLSINDSIQILKSEYGIDNKNPDKNLRFILGKCSPVLLVPGIYSTKLKAEFNCKGLATEEKDTTLKEIRLYCGDEICKDETKTSEEYQFMFSYFDARFGINPVNLLKHGACLGHIATYFQNEKECPKAGNKNICHYSKYVKVGFFGGTTKSLKDSRCGVEGVINVMQTVSLTADSILSTLAKVAGSFKFISENLKKKNYKEGFSLAALPNDYRRYLGTNNFATEVFKSQINRLYENTGKPVVVIAHSYGTLLTLTNLLKNKEDNEFLKKIKKFVAIAPPFSGSSKLLDVFLHTSKDFDIGATFYPAFGQYLMYKSLPTIMELKPQPMPAKIFTDPEYKELGDALKERLEIERDCKNKDCDLAEIAKKTKKFDEIFEGYFPSLLDSECEFESFLSTETLNRKCFTNIYNVGNCPTIIKKSVEPNEKDFEKDLYCNKFDEKYIYQGECNNNKRNCLDEVYYSNQCPNVYKDALAVDFIIDRFNRKFSHIYGKIDENYFDNYETIKLGVKNSIEYQKKIDLIKNLPVPPVDTDLVYASFFPTIAALVLDDDIFMMDGTYYKKGGDDTVPTWSSLLTGLKWIYDKKRYNLNQNIKLIEYCSRLGNIGKYKYDPKKDQNFGAISCTCLDKNTNFYKQKIGDCSHAGMLSDDNLFNYIYSVINDEKEIIAHTDSKIKAAKRYDINFDYVGKCNKDLYDILETAK